MQHTIQQRYRHFVQHQIVQWEMRFLRQAPRCGLAWESSGIFALFSAAAACGALAQAHLG